MHIFCGDELNALLALVQVVMPYLPRLKAMYYRIRQRLLTP
jgi:hypothetical protein